MSAFRRAVLSVAPDRLEEFTMEMKKNMSKKPSKSKRSKRDRSPSKDRSSKSKQRKKHSTREKDSKRPSSSNKKIDENARRKSYFNSPEREVKKHSKSSATKKSSSENTKSIPDSDFDSKDLDLSVPVDTLSSMVKDRQVLLDTAFSIVQGPKLTTMLPDILKRTSVDEIKQLCSDELKVMSSKRILHVLAGTEMESSSGTDSSDDDGGAVGDKNTVETTCQDRSLQTNHVDSTSDHAKPSMLFPSALSTAKSSVADGLDNELSSKSVSTSTEPQVMYAGMGTDYYSDCSDAEDGEVQSSSTSSSDEEVEAPASKDHHATEDVLVEEIEELEDIYDEAEKVVDNTTIKVSTVKCSPTIISKAKQALKAQVGDIHTMDGAMPEQGNNNPDSQQYAGKSQLEILELELRARAIRSLMKAAKTGKAKPAPAGDLNS